MAVVHSGMLGVHQELDQEPVQAWRLKSLEMATNLGATVSRGGLSWKRCEPSDGVYDFALVDAYLTECENAGLTRLMTISGSPQWANGSADEYVIPGAGSATDPAFVAWAQKYARFCGVLAARVALRSKPHYFEIWNEPNLTSGSGGEFWRSVPNTIHPNGAQYGYAAMLAKNAILAAYPGAQVAVGCITDWRGQGSQDWMRAAINAGLRSEIWSVHPYFDDPRVGNLYGKDWSDTNRVLDELVSGPGGHGVARIWCTEWGALVTGLTPGGAAPTTSQRNAVGADFAYCLSTVDELPAEMHVAFIDYDRIRAYDPVPLTGLFGVITDPALPLPARWPAGDAVAAAKFTGKFRPRYRPARQDLIDGLRALGLLA